MRYIAYAMKPGHEPRRIGVLVVRPGEGLSINREDLAAPSVRASEMVHGVGAKMTAEEIRRVTMRKYAASLAGSRWRRRKLLANCERRVHRAK